MTKYSLECEFEICFDVIGISSYLPDYRITWLLNTIFDLQLSRTDDIILEPSGRDKGDSLFADEVKNERFATYSYLKEDHSEEVRLISNRHNGHTLLKRHVQTDYFLRIDSSEHSTMDYVTALLEHKEIQTVGLLDIEELKSDIDIFYTNE